jgi:hypothetical protein
MANSTLDITLKALLDKTDAQADLDAFRKDESLKGITEKLKFDIDDKSLDTKLVGIRAEIDRTIKNLPRGELDLDGRKALASALRLRTQVESELKRAGHIDVDVRTDKALAQLAKFDAEAAALKDGLDAGGGGGGFLDFLSNGAGEGAESGGELAGTLGNVAMIAPVAAVALGALATEAAGLLAGFTAAGAGAGAFALLAYPAISKVTGALGDNKKQLDKLPTGLRDAVSAVQGLEGEWHKLANVLDPEVFTLIDKGVGVLAELLPDAIPFAQTFAGFLDQIAGAAKGFAVSSGFKGFLGDLHTIEGPALEAIAVGFSHVGGNLGKLLTVMSAKDVVNALNIAFSILDGTVIAFTNVVKFSEYAWDNGSKHLIDGFHDVVKAGLDAWHGLIDGENDFDGAMSSAVRFVTSTVSGYWRDAWGNISGWTKAGIDGVTNDFDSWRHDIAATADLINTDVNGFISRMWSDLKSQFTTGVHDIDSIFDGLEQGIETPVNFVLGIVNKVDGFLDKIPGVHLPTGMRLAAGGMVPFSGGGPAGRDSVHAMLAPGELVIPTSHAAHFADAARRASIPGFAAGGVAGVDFNPISAIGSGISDIGHVLTDILSKGAGVVVNSLTGPLSKIPGGGLDKTLATGMASAAVAGIKNAIGSAAASVAGVSGNVKSYTPDVIKAMTMLGIPMADLSAILRQMSSESGGNPLAVNHWDSNAKAGHPSTGLLQVIAGTYAQYAGPFRNTGPFENGVSINPLANIYAGLNYAVHAYGLNNLTNVLGHGHGYAAGGVLPEKVIGTGMTSGGLYSFGSGEHVSPFGAQGTATGPTQQPMTQTQGMNLLSMIAQQNKLLQGLPQALNTASRAGAARGANHGAYAAGG